MWFTVFSTAASIAIKLRRVAQGFPRMTRFWRSRWAIVVQVFLVIVFVAQPLVPIAAQDIPPKLTMFTSPDYPPYGYYVTTGSERKIVGFDVDIANYIAKELKFELDLKESDFNGLIPALQSKRADFVMAGMVPTPERKQNVDFSELYYQAKNTIVAKKSANITTLEQLKGKTVGIQLGTLQEQNAKKLKEKDASITLKPLNKVPDIIQEIKVGRIDAAIVEDTVARGFASTNPDLIFTEIPPQGPSGSAIAFPKGSPLVTPFNGVISKMRTAGELDRLVNKWFGQTINADGSTTPAAPTADATPVPDAVAATPPTGAKRGLDLDFGRIVPDIPFILAGIPVTLIFTISSLLLGLLWGTVLSLFKISNIKPLEWFSFIYTSIFRGTPLLLQLALVYYATPQLTGYNITPYQAAVFTFTLNSGAYMSETIRAGIQAVDKGQREAAMSLGVPYGLMMWDVIMPQALKNILPALVNETIGLLKDSSLVSTIGVVEILRAAQIVGANKYIYFEPLIFAGAIYYILVMGLTFAASTLEKRLRRSE
jgi:polar amino acid transport system substrate-binding protein